MGIDNGGLFPLLGRMRHGKLGTVMRREKILEKEKNRKGETR